MFGPNKFNKQQFQKQSLAALVCAMASSMALAEDGWSGKGEAGISLVSGNSQSQIVTTGLEVGKKVGSWEHSAKLSIIKSESTVDTKDADGNVVGEEEVETADSLLAGWVSKYSINDRGYFFGDLRYLDDKFDSFAAVQTYALGYGYKIVTKEKVKWDISAGLGFRDTEYDDKKFTDAQLEADGLERDVAAPTFVATSLYSHKFTSNTEFTNETRVEGTSDNTFVQNIAALSVSMSEAFAIKLKYDARHNTDPAPGDTSTDKITSVNLVYNF